jgi:hypothetical protein
VTTTIPRDANSARLGLVFVLWSLPLAASGIFITFSVNHAPTVGLIGLLVVALGTAITRVVAVLARSNSTRVWNGANVAAAVASLIVSALAAGGLVIGATLGTFTLLVATWAAVVAVCDILLSLNSAGPVVTRDFRVLALAGGALAVIEGALPLTSVYAVGILGAYGIVTCVYLVIAGLTLRFDSVTATSEGKQQS